MASSTPTTDSGAMASVEGSNQPPIDAIMADAPPMTANSNFQAQRTSTPQRNGTAAPSIGLASSAAAPAAEAAFPSKAAPHGARSRQYLNEKVVPVLLAGVKRVAAEKPEDPLRMLGEFFLTKSRELGESGAGGATGGLSAGKES